MYILFEKDQVVIPAKRRKAQPVSTGDEIIVQRQGVPEHLRIRFLNYDETPRGGVPYLLSLKTNRGILVADVSSETDRKGFIDHPIPPSAMFATITLKPQTWPEVYKFNLGYTNPIDKVSGWQARLNNLGYDCGAEDGELGPKPKQLSEPFSRLKN